MLKGDIDRTTPTPLYFQLKQILKEAIESGELKLGALIPTEMELRDQYSISRATVRQAILQLVNEGYLRREKGRGTFVAQPPAKIPLMESLRWFSAEMARKGIPQTTRILESAIVLPSPRVAECLHISETTPVFYLRRLRQLNDRPFMVDRHFIPHQLCAGIETKDLQNVSLYKTLVEEYHFDLHHGWREFQPVTPASKEEIELLEIFPGTPILLVESTVCARDGTPLDYFEAKILGKFTAEIVNAQELSGW